MLICIMCHFFRSMSDNAKCGIMLNLSTMEVTTCVVFVVSVFAMAKDAKNKKKKARKMVIILICLI